MRQLMVGLIVVLGFVSPAAAQSEATQAPAAALGTFQPNDFAHTTRSIVLTKLRRFLTVSKRADAELTNALANTLLLAALAQARSGDTVRAEATLAKFERESELLGAFVTELQARTTDEATQAFLGTVVTDRVVQVAAIEATLATNAGSRDIAAKLATEQAKTFREIAETLERETNPAERDARLAEVFEHYSKKQVKLEAKLAKKLAFAAKLDDMTDDEELETELEAEEDEVIGDADELDDEAVRELTDELDELEPGRRAAVLTKLLARVPATAKSAIETVLDELIEDQLERATDRTALKKFVESHSDSNEIQDKVIDRLKEKASTEKRKKHVEAVEKEVEQERETAKQADEQAKETQKKAEEQAREGTKQGQGRGSDDTSAAPATTAPTGTTSPTSSSPSSPTSTGSAGSPSSTSSDVEEEAIEVKVDDDGRLDKTSFRIKSGAQLTVKFKNETSVSRTLTLSNGKSVTTGKGEASIAPFQFTGSLTFTVSDVYGSGSISVE